jgi:hypothetical protein
MKNLISILIVAFLLFSCKNEEAKNVNNVINDVKANTEVVAQEGTGKILLICNGKELVTQGTCNAIISMGELMIGVKDKTNPAKVFLINFNSEDFPKNGFQYKIKAKDYLVEGESPKDEVAVSFSEGLPNNKMNTWGSENAKGTVQFSYSGNQVKCTIKDIVLTASETFNADDLKANGTVSGELTFYKN